MNDMLHLSLFQTDIVWQSPALNIDLLNKWLEKIPKNTDMVILPEMFLTGFSMEVDNIGQEMNGLGVSWITNIAKSNKITLLGSLAIKENNKFYNRMLIAMPDGRLHWYNKRHLFRMGEEHHHFTPGNKQIIVEFKGWNIMPMVCYDLRFPVWSRNKGLKYDLLIYVTNWPEPRREAYMTLLKARAIENQCYVVGVNRVGTDGKGIKYAGDSVVIDPKGKLASEPLQGAGIINCAISLEDLRSFRKSFPVHLDADDFELK